MSEIFVKGDINDLISSVETENLTLPQWLNIVDKNDNATSDNKLSEMYKNNYSETSDDKNSSVTSTAQNELFENNFSETSIENKNNKLFSETSIDSVTSALRSQINFNEDYSETSDNNNLNLSATSDNNDIFISQMGGNVEKTMASPDDINNLHNLIEQTSSNMATLYSKLTTKDIQNTNVVKLWVNVDGSVSNFAREISHIKNAAQAKS